MTTEPNEEQAFITCDITGVTKATKMGKNGPKLPPGWKRVNGKIYSKAAFKARFMLAAVVLPIASPVVPGKQSPEALKQGWTRLRADLREAWAHSTQTANWAIKELLKNDITRDATMSKCPPMPPIYLYGMRQDWAGWSSSASAVLRTVESRYRDIRYETIWKGEAQLPNMRYPQPFPWHNKSWKIKEETGGQIIFSAPLFGKRLTVRLRTGPRFHRQLRRVRFLIQNPDLRGEAAVYKKRKKKDDKDIMVKMVGYFPRTDPGKLSGDMFVRTDPDSLLVGLNAKEDRLWILNGDRARDWIIRHRRNIQRHAEDRKYETRRPKRKGRQYQQDLDKLTQKYRQRIDTYIEETAAAVVGHAKRRRLARIVYNENGPNFLDEFPWFQLAEQVKYVCEREGLEFHYVEKKKKEDDEE